MIATPHILIGGTVGLATNDPLLAFLGGVLSHFVLDMIPHSETTQWRAFDKNGRVPSDPLRWEYWFAFFDVLIGATVVWSLARTGSTFWPVIWGGLGGLMPDLIDNVPWWNKQLQDKKFFKQFHLLHDGIHFNLDRKWRIYGLIPSVLVIVYSLLWLI